MSGVVVVVDVALIFARRRSLVHSYKTGPDLSVGGDG